MSTGSVLRTIIKADVTDDGAVKVYADFLMEYLGYTRFTALRHAAIVRREVITKKQVADATRLIARGSIFHQRLVERISAEVDREEFEGLTVYVVPGRRWPTGNRQSMFTDGEWVSGWTVTVGARWILEVVMNLSITAVYRPGSVGGAAWSN